MEYVYYPELGKSMLVPIPEEYTLVQRTESQQIAATGTEFLPFSGLVIDNLQRGCGVAGGTSMRKPNDITATIDMLGAGKTVFSVRIARGVSRTDGISGDFKVDVLDSYALPMFQATGTYLASVRVQHLEGIELAGHEFIKLNYDYFTKIICDGKSAFDMGSEIGNYYDP